MSPSEQRPNTKPPSDFYQYVLRETAVEIDRHKSYFRITIDPTEDIQAMVERAMEYSGCEVLSAVSPVLGGWQAVIKCPDQTILFLWQNSHKQPGL